MHAAPHNVHVLLCQCAGCGKRHCLSKPSVAWAATYSQP